MVFSYIGNHHVAFKHSTVYSSIGWVTRMTLGVLLIIICFIKLLVILPVLMACYGEDILWLGVDHNRQDDTRNKPFSKHSKHINKTNTKGQEAYLILDVWSRSSLRFQSNLYLHSALNNNKIYKDDICKALESNIASYIPIHNQSNYIHG